MKTYLVLLYERLPYGHVHHTMYVMEAENEDIARDACIRSAISENPNASFVSIHSYEVDLRTPMKILDDIN